MLNFWNDLRGIETLHLKSQPVTDRWSVTHFTRKTSAAAADRRERPITRGVLPFSALCLLIPLFVPAIGITKSDRPLRPDNQPLCGTGPQRQRETLVRAQYHDSRLRRLREHNSGPALLLQEKPTILQDAGDVVIIEDDGTLIQQPNPFNLAGRSFRFEPAGSTAYKISATSAILDTSRTTSIVGLTDDDSREISTGFTFEYYGVSYSSVLVNSDGNLTFLQGDSAHTDRDLWRFTSGPPRIGPFFMDLNPEQGGRILFRRDADGLLFVWDSVPQYSSGAPSKFNSFSVKLFKDGNIEFSYGQRMDSNDAVVGISPGGSQGGISAVKLLNDPPTAALEGTLVEVFATSLVVSEPAIARKFHQTHPDDFDHLNLFLGFDYDLGGNAWAYEINVKNEIQGIGLELLDDSLFYGSNGRLRSFLNMGTLGFGRYPDDPNVRVLGTNTTMGVMGQESGHRWLAFTPFRDGSVNSKSILGRDNAHWSFFYNSEGSVMEGNEILDQGADRGSQRFVTTSAATSRYSRLDQYIMGLIGKEEVPPSFLVENPTTSSFSPSSAPRIGVNFGGTRKDIAIESIIAANGERIPPVTQAPKVFRQAFIYLVNKGQTADASQVAKVQRIRDAWVDFFHRGTDGRGWILTNLQDTPGTAPSALFFPYFQGTTERYNGIAVANWGDTPADVLFQAYGNDGAALAQPSSIVNPRMITIAPGAQIALLAEQIHGLSFEAPRNGWIQANSTSSQVSGFFLDGDLDQTQLAGAVAGTQSATALYFTRAQLSANPSPTSPYRNLIDVVNPGSGNAQLVLALYDELGNIVDTASRVLPAKARLAEDLTSLFATWTGPRSLGYVKVTSDAGVIGYQSIDSGITFFGLPGMPSSTASTLYSAQFASGGDGSIQYFSDLVLINTSSQARQLQILLVDNTGAPVAGIRNPVSLNLAPGQQLRQRGEDLFGLPDASSSGTLVEGSLVVSSNGPGIIGDLTFGDPVKGRFLASLPLDGKPSSELVLSQVAEGSTGSAKPYFTGIALYNPGSSDTQITLDVYSQSGAQSGTAVFTLPKGGRRSNTLPQYVPNISQQAGGYIRIKSSAGPIIAFELFGTQGLDFLAAVPPQPITP